MKNAATSRQHSFWPVFSAAPHRMLFGAGATQMLCVMAWWFYALMARPAALPIVPVAGLHALLMIYGFLPLFIFGFLYTAGPRWLNVSPPTRTDYVPIFLCMFCGGIGELIGSYLSLSILVTFAMLAWIGWGMALFGWCRMVSVSSQPDKKHPRVLAGALLFGWAGLLAHLIWLHDGNPQLLHLSTSFGVWLFLAPVFLCVCHRMIPFFSSSILPPGEQPWRPYSLLWLLLTGVALHAVLTLVDLPQWTWLADLPLAAAALYTTWRWRFRASFKVRLVAMLHIGFLWFGVAMALFSLQRLLALVGISAMGLAPLHVLMIGFFLSVLLAMASRVTLGHSGRPLTATRATWVLFMIFQIGVVLRAVPDLVASGHPAVFLIAAAAVVFGCVATWFCLYAPSYVRRRADGQQG